MVTFMRNNGTTKWLILGLMAVAVIPMGCTTPTGGGSAAPATAEGQSTADTGDAGTVDVTADGQTSQSSGDATVTGDAPTDADAGTASVSASNVQFSAGGAGQDAPGSERRAQITIHIAGPSDGDPCADEFAVLDFTAVEGEDGTITLTGNSSVTLSGAGLQRAVSGQFSICIQVVANFNGTVTVSAVNIVASKGNRSADDDDDDDGDDDNDADTDGDNDNDNEDVDTDGDNDNGDMDTDGDNDNGDMNTDGDNDNNDMDTDGDYDDMNTNGNDNGNDNDADTDGDTDTNGDMDTNGNNSTTG